MVRKDIVSELRNRETVISMFLFVVLAMVVFHYAFTTPGGRDLSFLTGGMLWVVFVFGALLGLNRSFAHEKDEGCLDGLLLCPVDRVTIFLAKMTANLIFLGVIQLVAVPVFALFFASGRIVSHLPAFLALVVLADVGISALGTLLATIAMHTRARDLLLPIVFLPLVIPLVIAAASGTSDVLSGTAGSGAVLGRLAFLLVYDGVFLVLAYGTYDVAIGE
jgi:heme exporter protein B